MEDEILSLLNKVVVNTARIDAAMTILLSRHNDTEDSMRKMDKKLQTLAHRVEILEAKILP